MVARSMRCEYKVSALGAALPLNVKNLVAVSSGKGGVGKSTVAVNIAVALAQLGAKVGLMDADILGPNLPILMGITRMPPPNGQRFVPATAYGVEVVSMGLLPYLYTAVWQAADSGLPIARAMSFAYPGDAHTLNMDDQYLLGDSLLVAPVLDEKQTSRRVYLPAGEWFDFWTQERYSGGQTIPVSAPLDVLPVFARAGSIIPLWPPQEFVGQKEIDELTLRAYGSSGEGRSLLYEDDGERSDHHQTEAHRLSEITLGGDALAWRIVRGSYAPSYRRVRVEVFGLDAAPSRVAVRGGRLLAHDYAPDAARLVAEIETGGGFTLKFA